MRFKYCGGWGYKKHVDAAIPEIEKSFNNNFSYYLYQDADRTGRFEVTIHTTAPSPDDEGELIF